MKQKLFLFFAVLFISTVSAQNFNVGGVNYFIISAANRTVGVNASANYVGALVVPSTVSNANVTYTVVSILDSAFQNSTTLTSIVIPNTVTEIRNGAFRFCTNLTSVTIPNSVTWIGELSFNACFSLTSVVIPNSVTTIGIGGFAFCTGLTSLTISNSLTSFSVGVFQNCTSLTSLTIPSSVTSLGQDAIRGCSGLTSITIPSSVTSISNTVFMDCTALTSVKVNWATPLAITANVFQNVNIGAATLNVPVGTVALYQGTPVWQNFGTVVQPLAATHLNFDGVDDYVNCGTNPIFDFTTGTIEVMINVKESSINKAIISKRSSGSNTRWSFHVNENNNTFGLWTGTYYTTIDVGAIDPNTWYHVTFVIGTTDTAVYVDGVYKGLINSTINASLTGTPLIIGSTDLIYEQIGESFIGNIDNVRLWNTMRTATEINDSKNCELQGTETGLIAYYKFNQGFDAVDNTSITTLTDATANANNGTLTNFTKTGTTSNWLSGSPIVTGTTCSTQTLSNSDFAVATNIKIYPNPTNNFVTVEVNNLTNATLEVVDVTGKILMTQSLDENAKKVDLQKLPFGMYFFKVNTTQGNTVSKVIKN